MKVLLADDHQLMRQGLRALLERQGIDVVAEAADGHEAIAYAKQACPDVVVIDVAMPGLNGIDAARRIKAELPLVKILALSMNSDARYVNAMLEAGASGYLLKNAASDELLDALTAVLGGETYLSPAILRSNPSPVLRRGTPVPGSEKPLSAREREVLQLIAEGKTSNEIAGTLNIAVPTVETHRRQLMDKLNVRTIAELTKYAIREGLTSV
ncbi:MAG TPA: response regulator transcription factor [Polyangiaceae bacterium]|nr:response regulator transcription factor [Polyangiaceae bacterium]